jgi:hypothetical protein
VIVLFHEIHTIRKIEQKYILITVLLHEAPVCSGILKRTDNVKSGRGRPKLTWDESVKRDFKE